MKMKVKFSLALFLTALLVGGSLLGGVLAGDPAIAEADESQPQVITVTGTGTVNVAPDQAKINIGVVTMAPTAREAQQENAKLANKVINALVNAGIPREKIETQYYSIWPEYSYPKPEENKPPVVTAYRVSNTVQVTLDDAKKVGIVIDTAVEAGANSVESIQFLKKDTSQAQRQALQKACQEAKLKAEAIAQSLGVKITGILSVQESGGISYPPIYRAEKLAGGGAGDTPIQPGELQVNASVTVVFKIQ